MSYVPQIPDWFDVRKAAQVTAWFANRMGGSINILRATKYIYLADRLSMKQRDCPITGDNFVSMDFGPVNSFTYSYMNGEAPIKKEVWSEFLLPRNGHTLSIANPNMTSDSFDELSRSELVILEKIADTFANIDQFEIAEWTHEYCPEWRDPKGTSIPIDFATVFAKLNKENPIELAEDIQAERALVASSIA